MIVIVCFLVVVAPYISFNNSLFAVALAPFRCCGLLFTTLPSPFWWVRLGGVGSGRRFLLLGDLRVDVMFNLADGCAEDFGAPTGLHGGVTQFYIELTLNAGMPLLRELGLEQDQDQSHHQHHG